MAECAISGQTVVTGHYAVFTAEDGTRRFYALASPDPAVNEHYAGTVQTTAVSRSAVADDIYKLGPGVMRWNPPGGLPDNAGGRMQILPTGESAIVAQSIPASATARGVELTLALGAPTRVRTRARIPEMGGGELAVDVTLSVAIPFQE